MFGGKLTYYDYQDNTRITNTSEPSEPYEWQNEKTYIIPELKEKLIEIKESLPQDGRAWLDLELNDADIEDLLKMIDAYEENEGYEL